MQQSRFSSPMAVGQFAVAALSERRNSLRIQDRRSETAATKIKLTHYQSNPLYWVLSCFERSAAILAATCRLEAGATLEIRTALLLTDACPHDTS